MPLVTKPIITLAEAKEWLGIRAEVTTQDLRLKRFIALSASDIERATGRFFSYQQYTEYFTSRDSVTTDYDFSPGVLGTISSSDTGLYQRIAPQPLYLTGVNIDTSAPISVWYDPDMADMSDDGPYSDNDLLIAGTDYSVDSDEDTITINVGTRYRPRSIKVTYFAGYQSVAGTDGIDTISDTAPDDLKTAALIQTQFLTIKLKADNVGMNTERTTGAKDRIHAAPFMVTSGITLEVASLVAHYKRLRLGKA